MVDNMDCFQGLNIELIMKISEEYSITIDEALVRMGYDENDVSFEKNDIEDESIYIYEILKKEHPEWKDEQNITGPFEAGAGVFDFNKMFKYLKREGLARHDGLHNFEQIIKVYKESGMKPAEFYGKIFVSGLNSL